jgi:hypothetical protein
MGDPQKTVWISTRRLSRRAAQLIFYADSAMAFLGTRRRRAPDAKQALIGFILTTIAGGFFGFYLQNRSFTNQHKLSLREARWATASKLVESVISSIDSRYYRSRVVLHLLHAAEDSTSIADAMKDYRASRTTWDDRLNLNNSGINQYFGRRGGSLFRDSIGTVFVSSDSAIEELFFTWKEHKSPDPTISATAWNIFSLLEMKSLSFSAFDNLVNDSLNRGTFATGE